MNVMRINDTDIRRGRGRGRGRGRPDRKVTDAIASFRNRNRIVVDPGLSSSDTWETPLRAHGARITSTSSALASSARRGTSLSTNRGTRTPGSVSSTVESSVVLALTAGRGDARSEVGLAAIDLQFPHLILCQISDCQTYVNTLTKIHVFDPVDVIMPDTMHHHGNSGNRLHTLIKEKFPNLNVTAVSRVHFNESAGLDRIKTHCAKEYANVEFFVKHKYYALAAAAALLKYVEFIQHVVYAPKSMKIEFQGSPNTAVIDIESAQSLELVASQSGHFYINLLSSMDRCSTPMGRRLLRASILQPPCDERIIIERQSCVAELVANISRLSIIQPVVRRLFGADRLLSLSKQESGRNTVQCAEQNLNYVLVLKTCLDILPELAAVIADTQSAFFRKVQENLKNPEFKLIKEEILNIIHPDARSVVGYTSSNIQRCFAIKVGINDLLDIARQTYCELIDDMKTMVTQLAEKHRLTITLACNASLGFHIQMDVPRRLHFRMSDLPAEFIEIQKNKNSFTMTTNQLIVLSRQCQTACDELHMMSNVLLNSLLASIREHVGCLFQLIADIAELDLILSLAQISSVPEYTRPTFGPRLSLKNSRHPIMEAAGRERPVPNDVQASVPYNFHTIIGPNMSGKSVYLKQIVLLHIMAQVGCYVPAEKAEFRIADRIFCRICHRDDIECSASTFTHEVKETQYILQSVTPKSLIILDEVCRATDVNEGSSIAWSICEQLLMTSAFIFNATHFLYLARLADVYHNVTNHCFECTAQKSKNGENPRLIYTHKLKMGVELFGNYGIDLAEVSGMPETVIVKAREYAFNEDKTTKIVDEIHTGPTTWEKACYDYVTNMHILVETNRFNLEEISKIVNGIDLTKLEPSMKRNSVAGNTNVEEETKEKIGADQTTNVLEIPQTKNMEFSETEKNQQSPQIIIKRPTDPIDSSIKLKMPRYTPPIEKNIIDRVESLELKTNPEKQISPTESYRENEFKTALNSIIKYKEILFDTRKEKSNVSTGPSTSFVRPRNPSLASKIQELRNSFGTKHSSQGLLGNKSGILCSENIGNKTKGVSRVKFFDDPKEDDSFVDLNINTQMTELSGMVVGSPSQSICLCSRPIVSPISATNNFKQLNENLSLTSINSPDIPTMRLEPADFLITPNGPNETESADSDEFHQLYVPADFYEPWESSYRSQISEESEIARESALRKEADIFRQIEGQKFNEKEFFASARAPMFIDLCDDNEQ